MMSIVQLVFTLIMLLFKASKPGGVKALVAENLCLRQQLIVLTKGRKCSPNLSDWDRLVIALCSLAVNLKRLKWLAILVKLETILKIHRALVKKKYRKLFSKKIKKNMNSRGPSQELIDLVLEFKARNPSFGYLRIAMQISVKFGYNVDKHVVRRNGRSICSELNL